MTIVRFTAAGKTRNGVIDDIGTFTNSVIRL